MSISVKYGLILNNKDRHGNHCNVTGNHSAKKIQCLLLLNDCQ